MNTSNDDLSRRPICASQPAVKTPDPNLGRTGTSERTDDLLIQLSTKSEENKYLRAVAHIEFSRQRSTVFSAFRETSSVGASTFGF
jgi:hypothetical protein